MLDIPPEIFERVCDKARALDYTGYSEQYPPFGSWSKASLSRAELGRLWRRALAGSARLGLYVNFPFCRRKCEFCFLPVIACPPGRREEVAAEYLRLLEKEMELLPAAARRRELETVYLGGGTPSLMPPERLRELFALLRSGFRFGARTQINAEIDPADLGPELLAALRACGVSRVCLGVQSFAAAAIRRAGRRGAPGLAEKTAALRAAGIKCNLDIICGLPGQGRADFLRDVRSALAMRPDQVHLNAFSATPYTLHSMRGGRAPDEASLRALLSEGFALLKKSGYVMADYDSAGLTRASRNFQTSGLRDRNSVLGLGPSSVSRAFGAARYINFSGWERWRAALKAGRPPVCRLARTDLRDEKIYFALESFAAPGGKLSFAEYRRTFGPSFAADFPGELPALKAAGCRPAAGGLVCPPTALSSARRLLWRKPVLTGIAASLKEAGPGWVK
jgi:oxygen-independent coproporphyrinogen-3 oxidase